MRINGIIGVFAFLLGCGGSSPDGEALQAEASSDLTVICIACVQQVPVTLASGVNPTSIALDDTYVYFTNAASLPYELDRVPLAGLTSLQQRTVLATNNVPMSSLLRYGSVLYWADFSGSSSAGGTWQMSTPSGTAFQISQHPSDFTSRQGVAVYQSGVPGTITTRHVLFASVLNAAIWDHRSLLFSNTEVSLLPPVDPVTHLAYYPFSMAIDSSKVYFTHDQGQGVWSAPLAGGAATQLTSNVNRDTLATYGGNLYFQKGADLVSMPGGGGAITTLVPSAGTIGQIVAFDGSIFWTCSSCGTVSKLSLTPGSTKVTLASGQTNPQALAVQDDTWVYFGTSTALKRVHQ